MNSFGVNNSTQANIISPLYGTGNTALANDNGTKGKVTTGSHVRGSGDRGHHTDNKKIDATVRGANRVSDTSLDKNDAKYDPVHDASGYLRQYTDVGNSVHDYFHTMFFPYQSQLSPENWNLSTSQASEATVDTINQTGSTLQGAVKTIENPLTFPSIMDNEVIINNRTQEILTLTQMIQQLQENFRRQSISFWVYVIFIIILCGCVGILYSIVYKNSLTPSAA